MKTKWHHRLIVLISLASWVNAVPGMAQRDTASINQTRIRTIVIGGGVGYAASMIALNEIWYKQSPRQPFSFFNDSHEWNQVDKVGHFFASFHVSHAVSKSLGWAGLPVKKSDLWGAVVGFTVISSIEVFDGFSEAYGASASDLVANATGSAFYFGQQCLWNEIRIQPKFSFSRTSYAPLRPSLLGENLLEEIIKDYNGQTYWLSIDADKFFTFPKWLNVAAGYGAEGMIFANQSANEAAGLRPYRQFYLGVDFDLTSIQTKSRFLKGVLFFLNMIKLPAPAIEFNRDGVRVRPLMF